LKQIYDDILEELRDDIDDLPVLNHAPDNFKQLYDIDFDLLSGDSCLCCGIVAGPGRSFQVQVKKIGYKFFVFN
jgi:hypothetical protein